MIKELKGAFNILNLPLLNAFLKLDPCGLPDRDLLSFESYGMKELKVLHDFYGTGKQDMFQGRMVQADALYHTQFSSLLLEFRNFKSYAYQQKIVNAHRYKTRKCLRELEDELYIIAEKVNDPLSVEYLLKDTVVETAFANIWWLLKIYVLILS